MNFFVAEKVYPDYKNMLSSIKQYYKLWRLARNRLLSEDDYRTFQSYQAELIVKYFEKHHINIKNVHFLDLGSSSIAGYSRFFSSWGANVISVDLTIFSNEMNKCFQSVCANALEIPFQTESIDFVFCASLIEHLANPQLLICEIERVLKNGGICYLSFPPFYSPMGGHEFSPYHYLGEKVALTLQSRHKRMPLWLKELYGAPIEPTSFADLYPDWGLYKMTIKKAKRLITQSNLKLLDISTRYLPFSFVRWPILGELLTWHVQFILVKLPNNQTTRSENK